MQKGCLFLLLVALFATEVNFKQKAIRIIVPTILAVIFLLLLVIIAMRKKILTCRRSPILRNWIWHKDDHTGKLINKTL